MNVGQFNNILSCDCASWNAHRLVNEYVKIAWMVNDTVPFKNLPWDNQVRILRVTSVIRAYLGLESCMFEPFDIIGSVFLILKIKMSCLILNLVMLILLF